MLVAGNWKMNLGHADAVGLAADVVQATEDATTSVAVAVCPPAEASATFMDCAYDWADQHLGDDVDWDRLAELAAKAIAALRKAELEVRPLQSYYSRHR